MIDRHTLKINEIKFYIQLPKYNYIIEDTVNEILVNGCKLLAVNKGKSLHQTTVHDCAIYLGVEESRDRILLLWDLFHEFGHHQDPNKLKKEDIDNDNELKRREITAWRFADERFHKYPELLEEKDSYITYRSQCLATYGVIDY